jgi:hypothetical protein
MTIHERGCSEETDQIPFSQRLESRIAFIESCLKQRLLRPEEVDDGIYRVRESIVSGWVNSGRWVAIGIQSHVLTPFFAFADIVLERRDGAVMAILVPPDFHGQLARSRQLRIDTYRRPFILGETFSGDFSTKRAYTEAMRARRDLIRNRTGLHLTDPDSLPPGPLWGGFVLSVDPGHVSPSKLQPWTIVDRGRALGDLVFRLDDGRLVAIVLDPEEAEAAIRSRSRRLMFDVHRRTMIL